MPAAQSAAVSTDEKGSTGVGDKLKQLLASANKGGKKGGLVRVKLYRQQTASSASGLALAAADTITVGGFPEVSSYWSLLYDEVLVHGGKYHFQLNDSIAVPGPRWGVVCFDPLNAGVLGTIVDGLEHSQHMLWGTQADTSGVGETNTPAIYTKDGKLTFKFNVKSFKAIESTSQAATNLFVPGQWHDLKSGGGQSVCSDGAIKFYVENASTNVVTLDSILELDVSFRSRT